MIVLPLCISQVADILFSPDVPLAAWVISHIGKRSRKYEEMQRICALWSRTFSVGSGCTGTTCLSQA